MSDSDMAIEDSVAVHIVKPTADENKAADLTSLRGWALTGSEVPFRILPQVSKRNRAVIMCTNGGGSGFVQDSAAILGANAVFTAPAYVVPAGVTSVNYTTLSDQSGTLVVSYLNPAGVAIPIGTATGASDTVTVPVVPGTTIQAKYTNGAVAQAFFSMGHAFVGGSVLLGRQNQMSNPVTCFVLTAGASLVVEGASEIWCTPNGSAVGLSVEDEQYLAIL